VTLADNLVEILHGHWITGLGFLHPASHYFSVLPFGSIRNPDVGVLNAVMTFGIVGACLLYMPLLICLKAVVRGVRADVLTDEALRLGIAVWIIATVVASFTLIDLFSLGGLECTACMLGLAAAATSSAAPSGGAMERGPF
jgi:hypothetical protein